MAVPSAHGLELALIATVAQLFGAVGYPARTEQLAAVGADQLGRSAGPVGRNEENTFHRFPSLLFNMLNSNFTFHTSRNYRLVKELFNLLNIISGFERA